MWEPKGVYEENTGGVGSRQGQGTARCWDSGGRGSDDLRNKAFRGCCRFTLHIGLNSHNSSRGWVLVYSIGDEKAEAQRYKDAPAEVGFEPRFVCPPSPCWEEGSPGSPHFPGCSLWDEFGERVSLSCLVSMGPEASLRSAALRAGPGLWEVSPPVYSQHQLLHVLSWELSSPVLL